MKSFRINEKMFLVKTKVDGNVNLPSDNLAVNHILAVDCSGSMSSDLPKIREQIKRKLPKLMSENDTLSIVWFSGRGQYGTLLEAEPLATLADLKTVEKAIDRWLQPVCLTGFKEPLDEVSKLVTRVSKKNSNAFSMMFLSDGHDNCWSHKEITDATINAATNLGSATFVEYGYYADRQLLAAMAEKAGGNLIFAEDFDRYSPQLENYVQKRGQSSKRVSVETPGDVLCGFAFAVGNGEITTYTVDNGKVNVPESVTDVWYLSPTKQGTLADSINATEAASAAYAALSLLSIRMKPEIVYPILKTLGDVKFIEQFASCFGKQKYTEFMEDTRQAAFDSAQRLTSGYDPTRVPRDDAFTVLDFLELLQNDSEAKILVDHAGFKYTRIGRGRVDANDALTQDEQKQVDELTVKMKSETNPKALATLAKQISAITDKPEALKFEPRPAPDGYSVNGLVFAEDRPNVSFRVLKHGTVDLSARLPEEFKGTTLGKVPEKFETFVYRNYTVVKDGMCNIEWLPIKCSKSTEKKIRSNLKPHLVVGSNDELHVNLKALPVVNRKMVNEVSAKTLFEKQYELLNARAAQKVWSSIKKTFTDGRKSEAFEALYGTDAANWLKEQGITDYSGFNPKSVQAPATDFYMAKELAVSIKGFSSLPSLKDVQDKLKKGGKLTPSQALMVPFVEEYEKLLMKTVAGPNVVAEIVNTNLEAATTKARELILDLAKIKFAVVVGQTWFKEFSSINENTMKLNGLDCKVEMNEVKVNV